MKHLNLFGRPSLLTAAVVLTFAAASLGLAQTEAIEAYNSWYATQTDDAAAKAQSDIVKRPSPCMSR